MPRISLKPLSNVQRNQLLKNLEKIGFKHLKNDLYNTLLSNLPSNLLSDKEFLARYLLLAAILDQQAESNTAKITILEIYKKSNGDFFFNPRRYVSKFDSILLVAANLYRPKMRVLRVSKEGIILWRIGGYIITIENIISKYGSLIGYLAGFKNPRDMFNGLRANPFISGLLYEKATRLYVGWVSHPNLFVDISSNKWSPSDIPMVINGHVCKVLARTGFLRDVLVEKDTLIVQASNERKRIEREVVTLYPGGDYFSIDYGCFYIGINYCFEREPNCRECPLRNLCKRNTFVRAY